MYEFCAATSLQLHPQLLFKPSRLTEHLRYYQHEKCYSIKLINTSEQCYLQTRITFSVLCQLFHVIQHGTEPHMTQMLALITCQQTNHKHN